LPTSRLQQVIKEYRKQLIAHEAQAEQVLESAYKQTLLSIDTHLDLLYKAMEAKIKLGEEVPLEWLYENHRLQTIQQLLTSQFDYYGALTRQQVGSLQQYGIFLGNQSAQVLLQSTVPAGINFSFGVPMQGAIYSQIGATQPGSPLYDLFNGFGVEATKVASQALIRGVTLGYNPRDIARDVQDALQVSRYRALTMARTEMLRSYRTSQLENFRANSDVVGQWRWTCDLSPRTCAACIAMDGSMHDLSEEMESHPNCRCTTVPVTNSWDSILGPLGIDTSGIEDSNPVDSMQSGGDWFGAQSEKVQRSILGNAKYAAWSNGDFELSDIVGYSHDKDWGTSIYEKPLKALVK
jgi:SPP1 gp7 family putative phage head morphogenesis protein